MTQHLPCGAEVEVHISESTPMLELKRQLQEATGVPIQHQVVMLSAINQLVMGDDRVPQMGFASCGTASSLYFPLLGAGSSSLVAQRQ